MSLSITLVFLLILILAGVAVLHNARQAISRELQSSANLALHLMTVALTGNLSNDAIRLQSRLIEQFEKIEKTRHLKIAVTDANDQTIIPFISDQNLTDEEDAPAWFSQLVQPDFSEYRRRLSTPAGSNLQIIVQPNPADEINEVWQETRTLLVILLLFAVLANGLVFFTTTRAIRPMEHVLEGLRVVESGDYKIRLPEFSLRELNRLSQKFNHMVEKLELSQRENHYLSQRLLEIQEQERRQLAHELHDELGQSISAIKALALSISRQEASTPGTSVRIANSITITCNHVHSFIKGILTRLRPMIIDELGLISALERHVDDWNAHHEDTFCSLRIHGQF